MIEYIAPTPRRKMTKARAARIFLREQGRCYLCGKQLRPGIDTYQIEHPEALSLGGSDDDELLRVVCTPCHKGKTAEDAKAKAKRDRVVSSGWQDGRKPSRLKGRGFPKRPKQNNASRPINKWSLLERREQ